MVGKSLIVKERTPTSSLVTDPPIETPAPEKEVFVVVEGDCSCWPRTYGGGGGYEGAFPLSIAGLEITTWFPPSETPRPPNA